RAVARAKLNRITVSLSNHTVYAGRGDRHARSGASDEVLPAAGAKRVSRVSFPQHHERKRLRVSTKKLKAVIFRVRI
ncbi:MAG: hypothetical protein DMG70_05185, partial [Acidobacteria bacterium]